MQFWVLSPCTEHWVVCSFQCFIYFIQNIQNNFGIKFRDLLHLVQGSLTQNFSFTPSSFLYSLWFHFYLLIPSIQPSLNFLSDPYYLIISLWSILSHHLSLIPLFSSNLPDFAFLLYSIWSYFPLFVPSIRPFLLYSRLFPKLPPISLFSSTPSDHAILFPSLRSHFFLHYLRSHFLPPIHLLPSTPADPGFLLNSSDPFFRPWFPPINLFFSFNP